ncbi:MAG: hypothetical protein ABIR47_18080 [Candidatus Kapaibacterium sp.]
MAKGKEVEEDILWKMLSSELGIPEIRELQNYLAGESDHYEMGYGELAIEPYDGRGGHSAIFRVRHARHGETMVSASALQSALHDLIHELRR